MAANSEQQNQNVQQQPFEAFFEGWLLRQQNLLEQLLSVSAMPNSTNKIHHQKTLIAQVLSHYQQYFKEKSRVANVDVLLLFSPTWLFPPERALLWIADYKPCLILKLVDGAVEGLTAEQKQRLDGIQDETEEEKEVTAALAVTVQFQQRVKKWGLGRDAVSPHPGTETSLAPQAPME